MPPLLEIDQLLRATEPVGGGVHYWRGDRVCGDPSPKPLACVDGEASIGTEQGTLGQCGGGRLRELGVRNGANLGSRRRRGGGGCGRGMGGGAADAASAAGVGGDGAAIGPSGGDDLRDAYVATVAAGLGAELADEVGRETEDGGGGKGTAVVAGEGRRG